MDDVCISAAIAWYHYTTLEMEGVAPVSVDFPSGLSPSKCWSCSQDIPWAGNYCPHCGKSRFGSGIVPCARCRGRPL